MITDISQCGLTCSTPVIVSHRNQISSRDWFRSCAHSEVQRSVRSVDPVLQCLVAALLGIGLFPPLRSSKLCGNK